MDKELLISSAFDSFWNWLLGGVMLAISVIAFFYPNLQPVINWPTLSQVLPPAGWIVLGIIIWLVGFAWNVIKRLREKQKPVASRARRAPIDLKKLRLADGLIKRSVETTYYNVTINEYAMTVVNESGHDIERCGVFLDEVAWKNFDEKWEIKARDISAQPFRWNKDYLLEGRINIKDMDRASFTFASSNIHPIYNSTTKQNESDTDFAFVFYEDEGASIDFGSNIRLKFGIRGLDEEGRKFLIEYLIYIHLTRGMAGSPLIINAMERIS